MKKRTSLSLVQLNDSHAYFDLHQEMFRHGNHAVYRPAGGYARIATIAKQIRDESQGRTLFCDCGDTLHGTYPALDTQGQGLIPILNSLGLDALTAHWEFAYGPKVFNQRVAELKYPMLACNVYDKETKKPMKRCSLANTTQRHSSRRKGSLRNTVAIVKTGRNGSLDALRTYLTGHRPLYAELRGTFVAT